MRLRAVIPPIIASIALVALFLLMSAQSGGHRTAAADSPPEEAELNPNGSAYEINVDSAGHLWISDYAADEIWQVNPATAAYTIYQGIQAPSDARRDDAGVVWWGDGVEGRFGRLDPASGAATWWATPGVSSLYGTQLDDNGDFWAAGFDGPYLYYFQLEAGQLCTYTLPLDGTTFYPQYQHGMVWLGDENNSRLLRLDPLAGQFDIWALPPDSAPIGMAFDQAGALWYADPNNAHLARFRPNADQLDIYDPPTGLLPEMVATRGDSVWYSEQWDQAIGELNPTLASSQTVTLTSTTSPAEITCKLVSPAHTETIPSIQGTLDWFTKTYSLLADSAGWRVYKLPEENQVEPLPWGVAADRDQVWFVDTGRQVLGRIPLEPLASVSACKLADADGDGNTTGDRTPIVDWTVYLEVDGVRREPGLLTGADGCAAWNNLGPAHNYAVEEELPAGWIALTPTRYDIGTLSPGESVVRTFVNRGSIQASACSLSDTDGDLLTTSDRTPLEGWTMRLTADGVPEEPGQLTDPNGCATWNDLESGVSYGVQEEVPSGWTALGATSHEFGVLIPGEAYTHTFISAESLTVGTCSLTDADGNPNTTGDQAPLPGQTFYLHLDGVRQEPGRVTGADGCQTWSDLAPDHAYGVEQGETVTYTLLGEAVYDFGVLPPGAVVTHTFINAESVTVGTCSLTDADGNPNTTGDQTPVEGWTVYLHLDGVRQEPGQVTGADGCQTWSDLAPDHAYGVEQASLPNYALLGEATHDFGVLAPGAAVSHNFVNARGVTVQACSLADADGDPLTTSDQAPLPGQTIYLLMEGERQGPGQVTGADGCLAWSDLAPNHTYGVKQILSPGWEALTLSTYTFDLALPGGTFQGTFINRRISLKLFVPLIFR